MLCEPHELYEPPLTQTCLAESGATLQNTGPDSCLAVYVLGSLVVEGSGVPAGPEGWKRH